MFPRVQQFLGARLRQAAGSRVKPPTVPHRSADVVSARRCVKLCTPAPPLLLFRSPPRHFLVVPTAVLSSRAFATQSGKNTNWQNADFYEILEVSRQATKADIKKAYYRLAKIHHPDANPDDVEGAKVRFQALADAYSTLSDDDSRAAYDRMGHRDFKTKRQSGVMSDDIDAAEVFKHVFEELGLGEIDVYFKSVAADAQNAAAVLWEKGDTGPAKEFAQKHKLLLAVVAIPILPIVVALRNPAVAANLLRAAGAAVFGVVQFGARNPVLRRLVYQTVYEQWLQTARRAAAKKASKSGKRR
eukprot:gnl/Spiro4/24041_TR11912_c0_g1_i1.p1 gnl/Spiro4/24041_TR11912_c0_g1~~gnl/Spiro4/24041_TR11912_c0_g1_i1.p1  ORF type:complete len:301 (-),score=52.86 gnl/Spiro4/24041_TR11912_c0_g1_i1:52-954(-)